ALSLGRSRVVRGNDPVRRGATLALLDSGFTPPGGVVPDDTEEPRLRGTVSLELFVARVTEHLVDRTVNNLAGGVAGIVAAHSRLHVVDLRQGEPDQVRVVRLDERLKLVLGHGCLPVQHP